MTFKHSVPKHFPKPKLIRNKPLLTVEDLLVKVSAETKKKARHVQVLSIEPMRAVSLLPGYSVYRIVTLNNENGHRYKLTIFSPTRRIRKDTKIIIDDPCPVFVFRYEYALAKRGNAFIYRTNGDPPMQTNPRLRPGLSHHGVRAVIDLVKYTKAFKERV